MENKMPLGLKIILVLSIVWTAYLIGEILIGANNPTVLFGLRLPYNLSLVHHFITLCIEIAWIISLIKRYSWGWKLFIATSLFGTANALVGIFTDPSLQFFARSIFFYVGLLLVAFMSYYVYIKRSYFNK